MNMKSSEMQLVAAIAIILSASVSGSASGTATSTSPSQVPSKPITAQAFSPIAKQNSALQCLDIDTSRGARITAAVDSYMAEYPEQSMPATMALLNETTAQTKFTTDLEWLAQRMGSDMSNQAKYTDALRVFNKLLETNQRLYGEKSTRLVETLNHIILTNINAKDYKAAQARLHQVLAIVDGSTQSVPEKAYELATVWERLAEVQQTTKDYAAAENSLTQALKLRRDGLGMDDEGLAEGYAKLGELAELTGNSTKALEQYLQALAIYDSKHPSSSEARILRNKIRNLCKS
jgi:tetratricopeptide (TPR) repeat protein